jgi:uncharacterized protein YlxW (UPF0749 family)
MRRPVSQITLAAAGLLVGWLAVVQLRGYVAGRPLEQRPTSELAGLAAELTRADAELRSQLAAALEERDAAQGDLRRAEAAIADGQAELDDLRGWSGTQAVGGPGVKVTIEGDFAGEAGQEVVNELWSAGAEAMAANGIRIVPGVVIWGGQSTAMHVGDSASGHTLVIVVIGDRETLTAVLGRPGGSVARLQEGYPKVTVEIATLDAAAVPATDRSLIPRDAQPHL